MNEERDTEKKPELIVRVTKPLGDLDLFLGTTWITGAPLVGDKIEDPKSGRTFVVTERTWLLGRDREANMAITIKEVAAEPAEVLPQPDRRQAH